MVSLSTTGPSRDKRTSRCDDHLFHCFITRASTILEKFADTAPIKRQAILTVLDRLISWLRQYGLYTRCNSRCSNAGTIVVLSRTAVDYSICAPADAGETKPHGYWVISLSLAGAATMLWQPGSNFPLPSSYGDWMGLAGGVAFALSNVLIRKDQGHSIQLKSLAVWLGVVLVGLSYSLFLPLPPALTDISLDSWLLLLGTGLIAFVLSLVVQYGLTHVPANQAIVILLFELVVAAVATYFLTNETMTLREWMGGAMIVSASLFSSRVNRE